MSRRTIIRVAILALSAIALLMVVSRLNKEPVYQGMPLSYWLPQLDKTVDKPAVAIGGGNPFMARTQPDYAARQTARAAIKAMDTNAMPYLLRMLRREDGPMRNHLVSWLDGHKWFKSKVKLGPSAEVSKSRALEAITCLGAAGQPALSDILPLMTNQSRAVKIRAFHALASISPATAAVKPFLPALMQALGDQEWTMRLAALNALAALQPPPPEATSVFIRLLKDANGMVSDAAMNYLVLQTNTAVIPVLDKDLHEKDSYAVTKAISRIAVFGAAAGGSEPRLRQLLNDPIFTVREAATNALAAMTGQSMSRSAPAENADITFNFPGMPVEYLLSQYEAMTGKKVAMAARPKSGQMVSFITVRPLTKSEALTLFEEVLKEQAGLIIVHGKDGSLTAVAKPQ